MSYWAKVKTLILRRYKAHLRQAGATIRDRRLADRLSRAFEKDLALSRVHGMHFYVLNGIVTIYGTVRHEFDRDLLIRFIREVHGVKDVVGHLRIDDSSHPP